MTPLIWILDILFPPRSTELLVRNAKEDALLALYRPRTRLIAKSFVTSLLPYRAALVQACILEAKFRANKKARRMLGVVLTRHTLNLHDRVTPLHYSIALIPVPLGAVRRKERGYNQVEEICKQAQALRPHLRHDKDAGNPLLVPPVLVTDLIVRNRETTAQTTLDGVHRRKNLQNAFTVVKTLDPTYLYIVIDDVLTTGATLSAAGRAVANDGARPISLLALAH